MNSAFLTIVKLKYVMIKGIIVQFKLLTKKIQYSLLDQNGRKKTINQTDQMSTFNSWSYELRISPKNN